MPDPYLAPWLSREEIRDLLHPLVQPAAQKRALQRVGILYKERPDGTPLVARDALAPGGSRVAPLTDEERGIRWTK
jgi:hypothetical protein